MAYNEVRLVGGGAGETLDPDLSFHGTLNPGHPWSSGCTLNPAPAPNPPLRSAAIEGAAPTRPVKAARHGGQAQDRGGTQGGGGNEEGAEKGEGRAEGEGGGEGGEGHGEQQT